MTKWPQPALNRLIRILSYLYPMLEDGIRVAESVGLSKAQIAFDRKAITNWHAIVQEARHERDIDEKIDAIVDFALSEYPENEALRSSRTYVPPPSVEGPPTADWRGNTSQAQLERILGPRSTLVSISYLEMGLLRARSVVRVKLADGSSGTGFITSGNMLITNNHVLLDAEAAASAVVQFNYQKTISGSDAQVEEFRLAPDEFFRTSPQDEDDWTAVRVKGDISEWGALEMKPGIVAAGDHVNVIQHPGGGQKQVSFVANVVAFVGRGRIQYLTDTLPGSSGSPVFDTDWNLVALHHSGGWLTEPNASSKIIYYRNEGIAIDKVIEGLAASI